MQFKNIPKFLRHLLLWKLQPKRILNKHTDIQIYHLRIKKNGQLKSQDSIYEYCSCSIYTYTSKYMFVSFLNVKNYTFNGYRYSTVLRQKEDISDYPILQLNYHYQEQKLMVKGTILQNSFIWLKERTMNMKFKENKRSLKYG